MPISALLVSMFPPPSRFSAPNHAAEAPLSPPSNAGIFPTKDARKGKAPLGQLSGVGALQLRRLGEWLRAAYVGQGLLPAELPDAASAAAAVAARSTNFTRNIHSMQNMLYGLYPPHTRGGGALTPILVRRLASETLLPSSGPPCPGLQRALGLGIHALAVASDAVAHPWDVSSHTAALATLQDHLGLDEQGAAAFLRDWRRCTCAEAAVADLLGFPRDAPQRQWWEALVRREAKGLQVTDPTAVAVEVPDPAGLGGSTHLFNSHTPGSDGATHALNHASISASFPWYAILDLAKCSYSHGVFPAWPGGDLHIDLFRRLQRCGVRQFQAAFATMPGLRLSIGRGWADILGQLHAAAGSVPPRQAAWAAPFAMQGRESPLIRAAPRPGHALSIFLGHDATLAPLLQSLRCHSGKEWPAYASTLIFELYEGAAPGEPHAVRVMYNGEPLPLARVLRRAETVREFEGAALRGSPSDAPSHGRLLTQPEGGWDATGSMSDADTLVSLPALSEYLAPFTVSEAAYSDACLASTLHKAAARP